MKNLHFAVIALALIFLQFHLVQAQSSPPQSDLPNRFKVMLKYTKKNLLKMIIVASLLTLLLSIEAISQPNLPEENLLAFTNATVIDVTGAKSRSKMTVVIAGNRIAEIGKTANTKIPVGTKVVDAAGKYLIPGLWDMHTHIWDKNMFFPAYFANGITGVRDMGTVTKPWVGWRKQVEEGALIGPRASIAGKIVDGFKPFFFFFVQALSEEEGRTQVRMLKNDGADFIKVYDRIQRNVYFAIAEEAKRQNMPFAGHVPTAVKASEASDAGQKSIEHLTGIALESSTDEDALRAAAIKAVDDVRGSNAKPEDVRVNLGRATEIDRTESLKTYDKAKAERLFARFRRNQTWQVPTLIVRDDFGDVAKTNQIASLLKYFPPLIQTLVLPENQSTAEKQAESRRIILKQLEIVKAMKKAGLRFLAGSDAPNPYSVPGFGLHGELAMFVEAGFTPLEALQTATRNPAEYLGQSDRFGTVETGKIADLVLLEADPLADINNTRRIAGVVFDGKLTLKPQLQEMLEGLKASLNNK